MDFCQECGASLAENQAVCPSCGAVAAGGGPASAIASNVAALLTYVPCIIAAVIFLSMEPYKKDPYVRFHAFQSIFFGVAWLTLWVIWDVVRMLLGVSSEGLSALMVLSLNALVYVGGPVYWAFLIYKAYCHQRYMIPILGRMAAEHAG